MSKDTLDPSDVLPLRPVDYQMLLVLGERDLHGYGLMTEVERESAGRVRLEVGSLYRVINRLLDLCLIDDEGETPHDADARRRRHYRITDFGRAAARAESQRLVDAIETARTRDLAAPARKA